MAKQVRRRYDPNRFKRQQTDVHNRTTINNLVLVSVLGDSQNFKLFDVESGFSIQKYNRHVSDGLFKFNQHWTVYTLLCHTLPNNEHYIKINEAQFSSSPLAKLFPNIEAITANFFKSDAVPYHLTSIVQVYIPNALLESDSLYQLANSVDGFNPLYSYCHFAEEDGELGLSNPQDAYVIHPTTQREISVRELLVNQEIKRYL